MQISRVDCNYTCLEALICNGPSILCPRLIVPCLGLNRQWQATGARQRRQGVRAGGARAAHRLRPRRRSSFESRFWTLDPRVGQRYVTFQSPSAHNTTRNPHPAIPAGRPRSSQDVPAFFPLWPGPDNLPNQYLRTNHPSATGLSQAPPFPVPGRVLLLPLVLLVTPMPE